MQNTSFFKLALVALVAVFFASCDKDYNEVGSDIVGDDHFGLAKDEATSVLAYNQSLGPVQSNNLPINALGYYNHPVFGKTTANFVTQVELLSVNPTIGVNPTIKSVELSLPYYSTLKETEEDGDHIYELDSIYGGYGHKFKLSVYESSYYLRDYDASTGFQESQKYYSDQAFTYNPTRLNDDTASQNDEFFFSKDEIVTYKPAVGSEPPVVDTRSAPGMRLQLNKPFFQNKIFGTGAAGKLINNNTFKEYFRGLYFKAESTSNTVDPGSLAMLNFKQGKVTVTYEIAKVDANGVALVDGSGAIIMDTENPKTMIINLGGNTVNVFDNAYNPDYVANITTGVNTTAGDENLYVKGQAGSMTVIELFGNTDVKGYDDGTGVFVPGANGVPDELEEWRHPLDGKQRLINEANLTFTVNQNPTVMGGVHKDEEPNRIYLYDLNNKRQLIDYFTDNSVGGNSKYNKWVHSGIIEKDGTTGKGIRYKIRLTNHIRNLIKNDSTNVRLGLVVTEDIKIVSTAKLKTSQSLNATTGHPTQTLDRVPLSSVLNPLGTVLYGSNVLVPDEKRLKLRIYYTKPN